MNCKVRRNNQFWQQKKLKMQERLSAIGDAICVQASKKDEFEKISLSVV